MSENYFSSFNAVDYGGQVKTKNNLSYLPWAIAWGSLKKVYPLSKYTVYENPDGWIYFTDGRTCWVKTGVTVVLEDGTEVEHIENLPVMDHRNQAIPADKVQSTDVNKAIQRSLTKACARHGVGLYVYAGEEFSEDLGKIRKDIIAAAKKKIAAGVSKEQINAIVAEYNDDNPNPNSIKSFTMGEVILATINEVEVPVKKK